MKGMAAGLPELRKKQWRKVAYFSSSKKGSQRMVVGMTGMGSQELHGMMGGES